MLSNILMLSSVVFLEHSQQEISPSAVHITGKQKT